MDVPPSANDWPWTDVLDALIAAPDPHRLLFENDRVRVLEVVIEAGAGEPEHTHRWPSVMIVNWPARIRYYERGVPTFESPARDTTPQRLKAVWMDAEGPHSVENIDTPMAHEGIPLPIIQRQLGHAHLGITSIYLQGIDTREIVETVHHRRPPVISASAGLRP